MDVDAETLSMDNGFMGLGYPVSLVLQNNYLPPERRYT